MGPEGMKMKKYIPYKCNASFNDMVKLVGERVTSEESSYQYMKDIQGEFHKLLVGANEIQITQRQEAYNYKLKKSPACGDYLLLKDGTYLRVTIDRYGNKIQANESGSFYIGEDGHFSMSGSCGDLYDGNSFELTNETKKGSCWHFDRDNVTGNNGLNYQLDLNVWKEK